MAAVKSSDASLERVVDVAFRNRGWNYRRNANELPGKPDFVFLKARVVVFVDGDFWHGWRFSLWRTKLTSYWKQKIERNRRRDQANFRRLRRLGWRVLRFWGHQVERDLAAVVSRVASFVEATKSRRSAVKR
jgi:DNA mismatch endonuclease (patch repair protein)